MTRPATRYAALPPTLAPLGLSRDAAAAYIGISATKFDELVADGRMPRPKMIDGRRVWARPALDSSFARLPTAGGDNGDEAGDVWDNVAV